MKHAHEGWGGNIRSAALLASTAMLALTAAYDNTAGWKKGEDGALVLDDSGNPIYVSADGRELSVEHGTIGRLNNESKGHRERAEAAERELKKFEGIDDPAKAREAMQTVKDLKDGDLINKGKLDEVKAEITRQYEGQLSEKDQTINGLSGKVNNMLLDGAFKSSEFIRDNIAVPADFVQAAFKDRFKIEDDKLVPYGSDGQPLYSKKRAGETADFEEALTQFVESHPQRDMILKAPDARGTGNTGGGGNRSGGRIVKRSDFDAMPPHQQQEVAAKAGTGEMQIVD